MKTLRILNNSLKSFYLVLLIGIITLEAIAASNTPNSGDLPIRRLNFLVSPYQKKFDPAAFSFQLQAKLMQLFHKKEMFVIIVNSSEEMAEKIIQILKRKNALVGNIWFDSHGHFQRRRSLFEIGTEEFNYRTIRDTVFTVHLKRLANYCDSNTNVAIGSCYGGATYILPAIETFPAQRMNGDTLMAGLSKLMNNATVFASESFVMTGPGILNAGYALSGCPGRNKFKDPIYKPVWEKLGEWNCYSGKNQRFEDPVTVSLNQDGSIFFKTMNYLDFEKNKKKLSKNLHLLKKGNYNIAYLYQKQ
jgi:hypothetical protein